MNEKNKIQKIQNFFKLNLTSDNLSNRKFHFNLTNYLLFDVDISSNCEFIQKIQSAYFDSFLFNFDLKNKQKIIILDSHSFDLITYFSIFENWSSFIFRETTKKQKEMNYNGIILCDFNLNFIAYQYYPIDTGIFIIKNDGNNFYKNLKNDDWFFE